MVSILKEKEIFDIVDGIDVVDAIEKGFIEYSKKRVIVPPVGELLFDKPVGEAHIKYGYIKEDDYYCIKIASGFYGNTELGISSSQGMMLLFSQKTGEPVAILLEGGNLTNIRTAAAGAVAARHFAPSKVKATGILGAGIQGRLQLKYLKNIINCSKAWIWDINPQAAIKYKQELEAEYDIEIASSPTEVARNCNLIITTTPASSPLLHKEDIRPGTHITAVGSDTQVKQELDSDILCMADIVISDSIDQSLTRGEVYQARKNNAFDQKKIIELGKAIIDKKLQRSNDNQISVVDLTGVAVQDIMIATAVYRSHLSNKK
ncbi:MAG TPA: ornithine cyclodeaminase family protein [Bacteroidales bacterium]|nr:ornithine cyclodeaminase family protein [Bacteroidales bacterium]